MLYIANRLSKINSSLQVFRQAEKANLKEKNCVTLIIYPNTIATVKSSIVDRFTKINNSLQVLANLQQCGQIKFTRFSRFF
jgi:hypothetical protein